MARTSAPPLETVEVLSTGLGEGRALNRGRDRRSIGQLLHGRPLQVPPGGVLVAIAEIDERGLGERPPQELQRRGQAVLAEAVGTHSAGSPARLPAGIVAGGAGLSAEGDGEGDGDGPLPKSYPMGGATAVRVGVTSAS